MASANNVTISQIPAGPVLNKAGFYAPNAVFVLLSLVFVGLRIWSRRIQRLKWDWSDYCVIVALVMSLLVAVAAYIGVLHGAGEHVDYLVYLDPSQSNIIDLLKLLMFALIPYLLSLAFSRLSILLLYRSIFPSQFMRVSTVALAIVMVMVTVAGILTTIFSCRPVDGFWLSHVMQPPPQCLDTFALYLALSLTSMVMDIACLLLPVRDILSMQLRRRDKVTVLAMFFMGGLTIVVTAPRTAFLAEGDRNDVTYWMANIALWSYIETAVAIICVCLPILRPVLRRVRAVVCPNRFNTTVDSKDLDTFPFGTNESWAQGGSRNFHVRKISAASVSVREVPKPYVVAHWFDLEKMSDIVEDNQKEADHELMMKTKASIEEKLVEARQRSDTSSNEKLKLKQKEKELELDLYSSDEESTSEFQFEDEELDQERYSQQSPISPNDLTKTMTTMTLYPDLQSASLVPKRCVSKYNLSWPAHQQRIAATRKHDGPIVILDIALPPRLAIVRSQSARTRKEEVIVEEASGTEEKEKRKENQMAEGRTWPRRYDSMQQYAGSSQERR